jgi:hypothetical protein
MHTFCYDKEVTLRPGEIFWPRKAWLCELSECIWRLSSLHRRGRNDLWSRVVAIDNRYPALKLSSKIEKLVDRAAKLYYEPTASAIQRQAIAGNQAAHDCFAAVQRCHDGRSKISSENWEPYREILRPLPAESCADKVEQLVADWWRNDLSPDNRGTTWHPGSPQSATPVWRQNWSVPTPLTFFTPHSLNARAGGGAEH